MKKILLLSIILFSIISVNAQTENTKYNKLLADSLGADEYGMKSYMFVILKTGAKQVKDKDSLNILFKGHMNNINRLVDIKKLVVAGPFEKNENSYRGLFILNVNTKEEALDLLRTDPAIAAGIFDTEIFKWYGSAALSEYLKYCDLITQKKY
jgi:uncharacterized protein YciI